MIPHGFGVLPHSGILTLLVLPPPSAYWALVLWGPYRGSSVFSRLARGGLGVASYWHDRCVFSSIALLFLEPFNTVQLMNFLGPGTNGPMSLPSFLGVLIQTSVVYSFRRAGALSFITSLLSAREQFPQRRIALTRIVLGIANLASVFNRNTPPLEA